MPLWGGPTRGLTQARPCGPGNAAGKTVGSLPPPLLANYVDLEWGVHFLIGTISGLSLPAAETEEKEGE